MAQEETQIVAQEGTQIVAQEEILTEGVQEVLVQEKCIKQFAQNAEMNVKFLSNLQATGQFIAKNALGIRRQHNRRFIPSLFLFQ